MPGGVERSPRVILSPSKDKPKRHVQKMLDAVVALADVRNFIRLGAPAGLFEEFAHESLAEEFARQLPPAGNVPERLPMIGIARRDHKQPPVAYRDPRR